MSVKVRQSGQWVEVSGSSTSIPPGGIILWYGASNAIPAGFVLCDGNTLNDRSGLPNTLTLTSSSETTGISINNEGVSGTNANLPPYYALCYIMKT